MNRMTKLLPGALVIGLVAWAALAATTYTAPPHPTAHDSTGSAPWRYSSPFEGMAVIDVATTTVADQSVSLDSQLAGYLERIVVSHNGNDGAWSLTVTDHEGVTLWTKADLNALSDPVSYIIVADDVDGNPFGGPPFAGGLTLTIADADGGTGDTISVRLYVREAWRR